MSEEARFVIKRYEIAERTEYRINSRVFSLDDVCLDGYDEFVITADKIIEKVIEKWYGKHRKDGKPVNSKYDVSIKELIHFSIREFSKDFTALWNSFFELKGDDRINEKWFRKAMTVPRIKAMWWQIVRDNGWEMLAEGLMSKLIPFVWEMAKRKMLMVGALVPLPGLDSTTSSCSPTQDTPSRQSEAS